jgi:hypothetical protein
MSALLVFGRGRIHSRKDRRHPAKGKVGGGTPILGYEIDIPTTKLVVNEPEAIQVRAFFELYV